MYGLLQVVEADIESALLPLFEMYRRGVRFYTGRGRGGPNVAEALEWVAQGLIDPSPDLSCIALFDEAPPVLAEGLVKPVLIRSRPDGASRAGNCPALPV